MSFKLVDRIKKAKGLPGKYKRVLEAWASFGNKDGTNIRPSKEAVADRAGVSRWTVYKRTDEIMVAGILVPELNPDDHTEPVGVRKHYYPNGHWTTVYRLDLEKLPLLQKSTEDVLNPCSKIQQRHCSKTQHATVAKGDATIPIYPSASLQGNPTLYDPSVVRTTVVSKSVSRDFETIVKTETENLELGSEENPTPQDEDPICVWSESRGDYIGEEEVVRELRDSFPLFKSTVTPTPEDMRLMAEIIVRADDYSQLPSEAVKFAIKHKQNAPGLIPRTVKALHKAVFEGDPMAGLLAQTKEHDKSNCGLCLKELQALPCARCKGSTYGKPVVEHGKAFCGDCMKLPQYRRHSGERNILTAGGRDI